MNNGIVRIVANATTDGVILILEHGAVVPYGFFAFAPTGKLSDIKKEFAVEAAGGAVFGMMTPYASYIGEIEHPDAVVVFTKEDGWLI